VGHDTNTTIHLAEVIAGVPYRVERSCIVERDGRPVRIEYEENDHCCALFGLADAWLRSNGDQWEGRVGHGHARLVPARTVVDVVVQRLTRDPLIFLHPVEACCADCDEARASISRPAS